jgi:hypothetical protein
VSGEGRRGRGPRPGSIRSTRSTGCRRSSRRWPNRWSSQRGARRTSNCAGARGAAAAVGTNPAEAARPGSHSQVASGPAGVGRSRPAPVADLRTSSQATHQADAHRPDRDGSVRKAAAREAARRDPLRALEERKGRARAIRRRGSSAHRGAHHGHAHTARRTRPRTCQTIPSSSADRCAVGRRRAQRLPARSDELGQRCRGHSEVWSGGRLRSVEDILVVPLTDAATSRLPQFLQDALDTADCPQRGTSSRLTARPKASSLSMQRSTTLTGQSSKISKSSIRPARSKRFRPSSMSTSKSRSLSPSCSPRPLNQTPPHERRHCGRTRPALSTSRLATRRATVLHSALECRRSAASLDLRARQDRGRRIPPHEPNVHCHRLLAGCVRPSNASRPRSSQQGRADSRRRGAVSDRRGLVPSRTCGGWQGNGSCGPPPGSTHRRPAPPAHQLPSSSLRVATVHRAHPPVAVGLHPIERRPGPDDGCSRSDDRYLGDRLHNDVSFGPLRGGSRRGVIFWPRSPRSH